uniref:Peptidase C1A papain C-terminal domain-containing protein n=1 Tax=Kalanchoe fedtschenkoi TaxID=63787 RepID=A0A7N0UH74_KALFE
MENEEYCPCCWTFSAMAAVESLIKIKTCKLLCLSEQELLDCEFAFQWIKKNRIVLHSVYLYTGWRGNCKCHRISPPAAKISGYKYVSCDNEVALQIAVSNYCEGIITEEGCEGLSLPIQYKELNHFITLVGYDTTPDGRKYWITKNSWGTKWGDKGFEKLERDMSSSEGVLEVNMLAFYPIF